MLLKEKLSKEDLIILFLLLGLAALVYFEAAKMPSRQMGMVGGGLWPQIVAVVIALLIITIIFNHLILISRNQQVINSGLEDDLSLAQEYEGSKKGGESRVYSATIAGVFLVYISLINYVGFIFATPLLIFTVIKLEKYRLNILLLLLLSIGVTVVFSVFFWRAFSVKPSKRCVILPSIQPLSVLKTSG